MAKLVKKKQRADDGAILNAQRIGAIAAEHKARDIRAYDVRGLTLIADAFVLCSASSEPHFKAVYNAVHDGMKQAGVRPLRAEGNVHGNWRVIDYGDVVFHMFREEAREFYDLDGLWGDAPPIEVESGDE